MRTESKIGSSRLFQEIDLLKLIGFKETLRCAKRRRRTFIFATLSEEYTLHIFPRTTHVCIIRGAGLHTKHPRKVEQSARRNRSWTADESQYRNERTGLERGHGVPVTVCITESFYELQRVCRLLSYTTTCTRACLVQRYISRCMCWFWAGQFRIIW